MRPIYPFDLFLAQLLAGGSTAAIRLSPGASLVMLFLACAPLTAPRAWCQLPQVADERLGVDRLDLVSGQRLYGFILKSDPTATIFAVERDWLQRTHPDLNEQYTVREIDEATAARDELLARIDAWLDERQAATGFCRYLNFERERIQKEQIVAPESFFMQLSFGPDALRRQKRQAAERRQIAGLAYQHRLADVIITPTSILQQRLEEAGVQVANETVSLASQLPTYSRQSEQEWAAKQALIEFERYQRLEFQGTGSSFVEVGEDLDPAKLIPQLIGSNSLDAIQQLGADLGLPEFKQQAQPKDWWQGMARQAAARGLRGVLITRLEQQLLNGQVTVTSHFMARGADDLWFQVASFRDQRRVGEASEQQREQLQQDPQVKQALQLVESLGLVDETRMRQAIDHGAATQEALRQVSNQFRSFVDQHIREISGPPISVPPNL